MIGSGASGGAGASGVGGAGGGVGAMGGEGGKVYGTCAEPCSAAADCVPAPVAEPSPYNEDNYACNGSLCAWTGCNSDAECAALAPGLLCRDFFGTPNCYQPCTVVDDCLPAVQFPSTDLDNYECDQGACKYLGCLNHAECDDGQGATVCADTPVGGRCTEPCETGWDCFTPGSPAFDIDNWECNGVCEYTGCGSNLECEQSLGAGFECIPP